MVSAAVAVEAEVATELQDEYDETTVRSYRSEAESAEETTTVPTRKVPQARTAASHIDVLAGDQSESSRAYYYSNAAPQVETSRYG